LPPPPLYPPGPYNAAVEEGEDAGAFTSWCWKRERPLGILTTAVLYLQKEREREREWDRK
jgi:hypothetical protein